MSYRASAEFAISVLYCRPPLYPISHPPEVRMPTRLRQRLPLLLVVLLAVLATAPAPASAAPRCFSETSFCIDGALRAFWERNGGLPAFGFPIGPQHEEQVEGRPVQVQWFERNRL